MKNVKNSSIHIQWDAVDDSLTTTTYTVTWTRERDHNLQSATLIEQSSYTITGLIFDTVYTITVTAANRCGNGPEFETRVSLSTATTSTTPSVSPTVTTSTNPMTIMSTASSVTITTTTSIVTTTTAMIYPSATATTSAINITSPGATVTTTTAIKNNLCTYECKGTK